MAVDDSHPGLIWCHRITLSPWFSDFQLQVMFVGKPREIHVTVLKLTKHLQHKDC